MQGKTENEAPEVIKTADFLVTIHVLSEIMGISIPTLRKYVNNFGAPQHSHGLYRLKDFVQWYLKSYGIASESGEQDDGAESDEGSLKRRQTKAETRYREAKAAQAELQLKILRGEYLPREEVEAEWASRVSAVRVGLLNFAKALPLDLVGKDAQGIEVVLRREAESLLNEYSRSGQYTPKVEPAERGVAPEGEDGVEAAGKAHGE